MPFRDEICDTTADALKHADAILIEVDMHRLEENVRGDWSAWS